MITFDRPVIPEFMNSVADRFHPAPELDEFVRSHFLNPESALYNEDHDHLIYANIAYLYTNVYNERGSRRIVGACEIPKVQGNRWTRSRHEFQMKEWFGEINFDFLITLDTNYFIVCDDLDFLSGLDHELYHAGQKMDFDGSPKFNQQTGLPMYALVGHDVEEHLGIVRRYGAGYAAGQTKELVRLAKKKPEIGAATIASMCGNCVKAK